MPQNNTAICSLSNTDLIPREPSLSRRASQAISSKITVYGMGDNEQNVLNEKQLHIKNKNPKEIRLDTHRHRTTRASGERCLEFSLLSHYILQDNT